MARRFNIEYHRARNNAARRGIAFLMTVDEWEGLLRRALGPRWKMRYGRRSRQFCMSRLGDTGPYKLGNVRVTTNKQNHQERIMSPEGRARVAAAARRKTGIKLGPMTLAHRQKISRTCKKNWRNQFTSAEEQRK